MTGPGSRPLRLIAVVAFTWVAGLTSPPARAVSPPTVNDALLPAAKSPAPREATEQSEPCHTTSGPSATDTDRPDSQLSAIDLQAIWRLSRGSGQTVAVIDTGVSRHRLLPHLIPGGDYVSSGDGTQDCDGHGTDRRRNHRRVPRNGNRAPRSAASLPMPPSWPSVSRATQFRRLSDPAGSGVGDVETLAMAVRTAADAGATVVNISSVACLPADGSLDDGSLGAALAYAVDVKNVVVVAAAGNVGGPGQCHEQNPRLGSGAARRPRLGCGEGRRQPVVVRRLRPDRGFGRPRRAPVAVQPGGTVGGRGRAGRGGGLPGPRRGGSDRYRTRFRSARADFGDQLCRTGGLRHCRLDPVARAAAHRETGDATHRGHRPPPGSGVGCRRSDTV